MRFRSLTLLVAALVAALDVAASAGAEGQGLQAGKIFRDCSDCPEMVVVPEGSFLMGSSAADTKRVLETLPSDENEGNRHSLLRVNSRNIP